jgi:hypothetical protein
LHGDGPRRTRRAEIDGQDLYPRLLPPDERVGEILLGVRGALLDEHDTPDAMSQQPAG